jgi:subtilisin family serine protease
MKIAFTMAALVVGLAAAQTPKPAVVEGEWLVRFAPGATASAFGASDIELVSRRLNVWLLREGGGTRALGKRLGQSPDVLVAQPNHRLSERNLASAAGYRETLAYVPNDTGFALQWHLHNAGGEGRVADADIDAPEGWAIERGATNADGEEVVIAVIDGGFAASHPDLRYRRNESEIPDNGVDDDGNGYADDYEGWNAYDLDGDLPEDWHGTHVAGVAAAIGDNDVGVAGVAWNASVLRVAGSSTFESTALRALDYTLETRARYNETDGAEGAFVVVVNGSFGVNGGDPENFPLWSAMYDSLGAHGVLSVVASANLPLDVDDYGDMPATCPSDFIVAVAATDARDSLAAFSSYGARSIDLAAPGVDILSTAPDSSYLVETGTSMAAPIVSGAIALLAASESSERRELSRMNPAAGALALKHALLAGVDPLPDLQAKTLTGGRLNLANSLAYATQSGSGAPNAIDAIAVEGTTSNEIGLSWRVPEGASPVVAYDLRHSTSPIADEADYLAATRYPISFAADSSGATERIVVEGLAPGTTYWFAARVVDIRGRFSPPSSAVVASTLAPPSIAVEPKEIVARIEPGGRLVETVTIANAAVAPSTLAFGASLGNQSYPEFASSASATNLLAPPSETLGKGATGAGGASIAGAGGPDAYGYRWIDSDAGGGPEFVWEDLAESGTEITAWEATGSSSPDDDGQFGPIALDFEFPFYGESKRRLYVNTNGVLAFEPFDVPGYRDDPIPTPVSPNGLIAPFWGDLDAKSGSACYYLADSTRVVVQFDDWGFYEASWRATFQAELRKNGTILFRYLKTDWPSDATTIGIESPYGDAGLQVARNSIFQKERYAIEIRSAPDWARADTLTGVAREGASVELRLEFVDRGFPTGVYRAELAIASNDPLAPEVVVPVAVGLGVTPPSVDKPARHALRQNYPNPFNGATTIRYELPEPCDVRLAVYNALGERVAVLDEGRRESGTHRVVFRANGRASGVYVIELRAGDIRKTVKAALVK